jgi:hypothetical protein
LTAKPTTTPGATKAVVGLLRVPYSLTPTKSTFTGEQEAQELICRYAGSTTLH